MQDRIEQNALELLHAIREHHPDIYAGAWVNPYTAALEAGLDPDSSSLQRGYGTSAGRGRTGGSGGIPRARGEEAGCTRSRSEAWRCCEMCDFGFSKSRPRRPPA